MLNRDPSPRQLRQFAAAGLVLMPLAAWLFAGRPLGDAWSPWHTRQIGGLAALGGVLVALSFVAPRALRPVFVAASLLTLPIGLVVGEILLAVIYFLVFTPVALLFRLIGRDALDRKFDRSAASYWRPKAPPRDATSYFRQS
ncbi:MAG: hypothetical protein WD875_19135 [Pirellulales bacterium]